MFVFLLLGQGKGLPKIKTTEEVKKPFINRWFLDDAHVFKHAGYFYGPTPPGVFNLHEGPAVSTVLLTPSDETNPRLLDDVDFYMRHVSFLCDHDPIATNWLHDFFAHMYQHPLVKPGIMPILCSDKQGTGKSQLVNIHTDIIGPGESIVINDGQNILGHFNSAIEGKLLVGFDECQIFKEEELRTLKSVLTSTSLAVTRKGGETRPAISVTRIIGTSNEDVPIKLKEGEHDRRTFLVECTGDRLSTEDGTRLQTIRQKKKVLRLIYDFYMRRDIAPNYNFALARPISEKSAQVAMDSRSPNVSAALSCLLQYVTEQRESQLAQADPSQNALPFTALKCVLDKGHLWTCAKQYLAVNFPAFAAATDMNRFFRQWQKFANIKRDAANAENGILLRHGSNQPDKYMIVNIDLCISWIHKNIN